MYDEKDYTHPENDPVKYAISIIESYQSEIRNLRLPSDTLMKIDNSQCSLFGDGVEQGTDGVVYLDKLGFCQGTIYTHAIARIKILAGLK